MNKPINLVFYAPSFDSLGGGEIWLNRVANEMRRRSHKVTVIGKRRPINPVPGIWEDGVNRFYLIDEPEVSNGAALPAWLGRVRARIAWTLTTGLGRRVDEMIGGWRPAGMFQRDIPAGAHARLLSVIRRAQDNASASPTVVICSDVYTASHVSAAVRGGHLQLDFLIIHHLSFASMTEGTCRAFRQAAEQAAGMVALTEEDAAEFRRAGFAHVCSIPNPNPNPSSDRHLGRSPQPRVVWLGRMTKQKSVHLVVDAWSRVRHAHPDWRLVLYGDGEERPRVVARIDELGVGDSVTLAGVTPDTQAAFAQASINVLPSQFEGWGLVIGEAGLEGVPTVAFDCAPGVRAQIENRVDGVLVPLNDLERLVVDLDLVMSDGRLRDALGAGARRRALTFSAARIGALWETLLAAVVSGSFESPA